MNFYSKKKVFGQSVLKDWIKEFPMVIGDVDHNVELNISSPVEDIVIGRNDDGEREITRNNKNVTTVSNDYYPVPDSLIVAGLVKQDYFSDLVENIETLEMNERGGFTLNFMKPIEEKGEVLDIFNNPIYSGRSHYLQKASALRIDDRPYGGYKKKLVIQNSFDKTKRFSIVLGLMRMVCSNGAFALIESDSNFVSDKILHINSNSTVIMSSIKKMMDKIPYLANEAEMLQEMKIQELKEDIKTKFYVQFTEWMKEKFDNIENKKDQIYWHKNAYFSMAVLFEEMLYRAKNVLDIVNVLSYFQVKGRFATNIKSVSEKAMTILKKIYAA